MKSLFDGEQENTFVFQCTEDAYKKCQQQQIPFKKVTFNRHTESVPGILFTGQAFCRFLVSGVISDN